MKKNASEKFWKILLLILCLILIGEFFLARSIRNYRNYDISLQDKALGNIVASVDATLKDFCDRYLTEIEYVTSRRGFIQAEEKWMNSGEAHDLLNRLKDDMLGKERIFDSIVAVVNGRILLSTNGKMDYWIPVSNDNKDKAELVICSDDSMQPYFAFVQHRENISYAAIINPIIFYAIIEENSGLKAMGDMILMDRDHSMFLYRDDNSVKAELLVDEGQLENPLLQIIYHSHMNENDSIDFYEVKKGPYRKTYKARVAISPYLNNANDFFTIGILHNVEEQTMVMQITAVQIIIFAGMIFLGLIIMLYYMFWIYRQDERNRKEIAILKAKEETLEAINTKTMEMAHHQRLETIGQLTSGVAHEFNNLLTPIMGYSLMTMENLPMEDEESYDNLMEIYDASRKAKELISRLSDLSRKNTSITMKDTNPQVIVERVLAMVNTSKPKKVELVTELHCQKALIHCNETQITQMLMNLILNAFHAIDEEKGGKVVVRNYVRGMEKMLHEKQVIFEVEDNGSGIPKKIKDKIFDPFFTTKEKGRGTGLGLAIVMQVVEEHKGKLTLDSEEGVGSKFQIALPMVEVEDTEE